MWWLAADSEEARAVTLSWTLSGSPSGFQSAVLQQITSWSRLPVKKCLPSRLQQHVQMMRLWGNVFLSEVATFSMTSRFAWSKLILVTAQLRSRETDNSIVESGLNSNWVT